MMIIRLFCALVVFNVAFSATVKYTLHISRGSNVGDGVIGVTQYATSTTAGQNSMVYTFSPDRLDTYCYQPSCHVHEQYIDGLYGALIVNRNDEEKFWTAHGAAYAQGSSTLTIANYYKTNGSSYLSWYIS